MEIAQLVPLLATLLGSKAALAKAENSVDASAKDAASQQLEILHTLLLLLPLPQVSQQFCKFVGAQSHFQFCLEFLVSLCQLLASTLKATIEQAALS